VSKYVRPAHQQGSSQLLQVIHEEDVYQFVVLVAGTDYIQTRKPRNRLQHTHDVYHVLLYTEGDSYFMLNNELYPTRPNTLVLTNPGQPHGFLAYGPGQCAYVEVCFAFQGTDGNLRIPFDELLSAFAGIKLSPLDFPVVMDERHAKRLAELLTVLSKNAWSSAPLAQMHLSITMLRILTLLAQEVYLARVARADSTDKNLDRAKSMLDSRYREQISLSELAEAAGLSRGYLHRAFRERYGVSPLAYQRSARIDMAKNLLASSDLPCKEIAEKTGFSNVYVFSKVFKRLMGMTASDYRRLHAKHLSKETLIYSSASTP